MRRPRSFVARTLGIPTAVTGVAILIAIALRDTLHAGAVRPLYVAVAASALFAGGRAALVSLVLATVGVVAVDGTSDIAFAVESPLADAASFVVTSAALIACIVFARRREVQARRRARGAQAATAAIAERFRTLFELAPVGLAIVDGPASDRVEVNPSLRRLLGLPTDVVVASTPLPFAIVRDGQSVPPNEMPMHRTAATGEAVDGVEFDVCRADGSVLHLVGSARPLRDREGRPSGAVAAYLDITDRKRAEHALQESEQRFRAVVESNMLGIVFVDPRSGLVTDANDALLALLGRSRDDVARGAVRWLDALAPEDHAGHRLLAAGTRPGDVVGAQERTLVRADGTRVPVLIGGTRASAGCAIGFVIDRTEREAAEHRLRESERRFRHIAESGLLAITFWTVDGTLVEPTNAFLAMVGWSREEWNAAGAGWRDIVVPGQEERHLAALGELRARGVCTPYETEFVRRDGRLVPVLLGAAMLGDDEGVSFALDMSEQRRLETWLAQQVEDLRTMLDIMPVGVTIAHDAAAEHISVNRYFADAVGIRAGQNASANGPGRRDLPYTCLRDGRPVDPQDLPMQTACRTGRQVLGVQWDLQRADGQVRHFLANAAPLFDERGRVRGAIGAHVDVSEMKRLDAALRESEARLDLAQTAGGVGVFDWDMRQDRIVWTRQLCGLFGIAPEDFDGTSAGWERRLHPEDRAAVRRLVDEAVGRRDETLSWECRIVLPDGGMRWLAAKARFFYDADGRPARMIGVNIDVSDRKHWEEALRESDRRKDEFLAMLGHELRNPLGPIRNAVQLFRILGSSEPRLVAARDLIDRQVTHLARLIDDLLDVSRITRGKIALRTERLDVAEVVANAVEQVRPMMDAKSHALVVRMPHAPIRLHADPARLVQVVGNLLANAAKYTEPGGRIEVDVGRTDGFATVRVRDSGIGISAETLPKVFDLFVQDTVSLDRAQGGLGIGLTLVRSLVEMHGGLVEAHSDGVGCGSEFVVRLPATDDEPDEAADATAGAHARVAGSPLRVLVVEDNHDARESFVTLLELSGHQVRSGGDGPSALEIVRGFRPDVAFLDLGLPGIDGYELARLLRDELGHRGTVLVAVSGYGRDEDKRAAFAAGFDHHLTKPVDFARVDALLADVTATLAQPAAQLH